MYFSIKCPKACLELQHRNIYGYTGYICMNVYIYTYVILFWNFYLLFIYLLLFKYNCPHFHHTSSPHPIHPHLTPSNLPLWLCPCVLYTCSLTALPLFSPNIPLPPLIWLLSVCSLFQCLWLYFACLFVLLIRFHL